MVNLSSVSKLLISHPSVGFSPSGFTRIHVELLPREVGRLIGYDPRVLVIKPKRSSVARGTRDVVPHNVSPQIVALQNQVQRSIDTDRVSQMVDYLAAAVDDRGAFADWGAIELVTSSTPDLQDLDKSHVVSLDADADYFIADGQHRYCAVLDFIQAYPQYADRFTQSVTLSVLPEEKMIEWAGQEFHDRNYFSVGVRAGKALSVDTRDPVNALAKALAEHPAVKENGGISYDRDALLKNDSHFATHTTLHRFVRGFLFGRPGLDKGVDTRSDIEPKARERLLEYVSGLNAVLPWGGDREAREEFLTRTSAVMSALAVVGNDLYSSDLKVEERAQKLAALHKIDWKRSNLQFVGVLGSEKDGKVAPTSSRQAIDGTIKFLREKLGLVKVN